MLGRTSRDEETGTKTPKSYKHGKTWILPLVFSTIVSLFILAEILSFGSVSTQSPLVSILSSLPFNQPFVSQQPVFVESVIQKTHVSPTKPGLARLAYLIAGSKGDGKKLKRALAALYHPRNHYIVHLDLESEATERADLAEHIASNPIYAQVMNVNIITKSNLVTYKGPSMVANTLHAIAVLLKQNKEWDWFINLSASDYPLVTQDDLLSVLSSLPRQLNFIEHTSKLAWKEEHRAKPIIIDPGLYMNQKAEIFWATERRSLPTAFKLFTGSAWMALSRSFVEYCIWGWDNLPRALLMYYANFVSSPEGYFHTVICNTEEYRNTTVNHDLHYISWDTPPRQHPHNLGLNDFQQMLESDAPFARKFQEDDPVLDKIDSELLGRPNGSFTPGGWCNNKLSKDGNPCSGVGNIKSLKPGNGAKRLQNLIDKLLSYHPVVPRQCV